MSFIMTAFWNTPKIKGYFGMLGGKIKVKTYTTIQKTILIVDFDTIILRYATDYCAGFSKIDLLHYLWK